MTYGEGDNAADFRLPTETALQKLSDADDILDVFMNAINVVLHRLHQPYNARHHHHHHHHHYHRHRRRRRRCHHHYYFYFRV